MSGHRVHSNEASRRVTARIGVVSLVLAAASAAGLAISAPSVAATGPTILVSDTTKNLVHRLGANGAATTTVGSGLATPGGMAFNAAGDLVVADTNNNRIVKITANGVQTVVASLNTPNAIAFDSVGNMYVASIGLGSVVRIAPNGTQTTVLSSLGFSYAVAVDGADNLYAADVNATSLLKRAPNGTVTSVGTGLNGPSGVSVSAAGDVYVSNAYAGTVVKITPAAVQTTFATDLDTPAHNAIGPDGNLYVAEQAASAVSKIEPDGTRTILTSPSLGALVGIAVTSLPFQKSQTVTFPAIANVTYGAADITPGATASSGLPITYSTTTPTVCTIVSGKIHIVGGGTCTVNADQLGNGAYSAATAQQSFTVNKKALTVTAQPATGSYGSPPTVTPGYSGFVPGDSAASLTTAPTCQPNTTATTPPGTYLATSSCSGGVSSSYSFTYVKGTVTITKATVALSTSSTTASASLAVGRMTFTTIATNAANGAPIAGLVVTVTVKINIFYSVTCKATTAANGVATCQSGNGNLSTQKYPKPYTATSPASTFYTAGSANGVIQP